jgi:hypothetical protein
MLLYEFIHQRSLIYIRWLDKYMDRRWINHLSWFIIFLTEIFLSNLKVSRAQIWFAGRMNQLISIASAIIFTIFDRGVKIISDENFFGWIKPCKLGHNEWIVAGQNGCPVRVYLAFIFHFYSFNFIKPESYYSNKFELPCGWKIEPNALHLNKR